jgi:hypothetical protein
MVCVFDVISFLNFITLAFLKYKIDIQLFSDFLQSIYILIKIEIRRQYYFHYKAYTVYYFYLVFNRKLMIYDPKSTRFKGKLIPKNFELISVSKISLKSI